MSAEPLEGGETVDAMASWARYHGIILVGGSITECREGRAKLSNTSVVFGRDGGIEAVYRKIFPRTLLFPLSCQTCSYGAYPGATLPQLLTGQPAPHALNLLPQGVRLNGRHVAKEGER